MRPEEGITGNIAEGILGSGTIENASRLEAGVRERGAVVIEVIVQDLCKHYRRLHSSIVEIIFRICIYDTKWLARTPVGLCRDSPAICGQARSPIMKVIG